MTRVLSAIAILFGLTFGGLFAEDAPKAPEAKGCPACALANQCADCAAKAAAVKCDKCTADKKCEACVAKAAEAHCDKCSHDKKCEKHAAAGKPEEKK